MTELDWLARLAALEQLGMRFEDAEELLIIGNRLSLEDPTTGLRYDLSAEPLELDQTCSETLVTGPR